MTIENVEGHRAEYGVAQGGHLLQLIARCCFTAWAVPWAPFVDHQLDCVLGILLAHDLPMPLDQIFDALPFTQQFIPVNCLELDRVALAFVPILSASAA